MHNFAPPRPAQSVILEPKYPTFGTSDGYCLRTELVGCITTTADGEQVTGGSYYNVLFPGEGDSHIKVTGVIAVTLFWRLHFVAYCASYSITF